MSEEVDWGQPIRNTSGWKRPGRSQSLFGVRQEQLRRAEALVTAAGGKWPKGEKQQARRVEALAAIVPALRYVSGSLVHQALAPNVEIMASATRRPGPGRKIEWCDDACLGLAQWVAQIQAEAGKPLEDELALRRVRARYLASAKQRAEDAGLVFDDDAKKEATLPTPRTLRKHLARGRKLQRGR